MSAQLDEEFGTFAGRPDHPDMDTLSLVVRTMDEQSEQPGFDLDQFIKQFADPGTVMYVGLQRTLRVLGLAGLPAEPEVLSLIMSAWIDGFCSGHGQAQVQHEDGAKHAAWEREDNDHG